MRGPRNKFAAWRIEYKHRRCVRGALGSPWSDVAHRGAARGLLIRRLAMEQVSSPIDQVAGGPFPLRSQTRRLGPKTRIYR